MAAPEMPLKINVEVVEIMSNESPVLLTIKDHIAEIRFNRPQVLNAINVATAESLRDIGKQLTGNPDVRVIVLSSEGRAFMAGGDLAFFHASEDKPAAGRELVHPIHEALEILAAAPQPIIASVQGAAAGAGMSIALMADLAIAADDAVFNMAYVKVGNNPDCGGSWALPRLVGVRKALEIALLADNIPAAEALRLNLVNRVVPRADLAAETQALAQRLAAAAPLALASIKRLMRVSMERTLSEQLHDEADSFVRNAASGDFTEALSAFFGKRPPSFTGR
jgi:2-(1,2-epoxy-1,2-dihydrophenyl)acetyl-CoA isomerase